MDDMFTALVFILFVFIGLHLFFLSIEIGWKHLRLKFMGQLTRGIVHHKQAKRANKYYIYYEFMVTNYKLDKHFIITQRAGVTKYTYDDYTEGDLITVMYLPKRPKDNIILENQNNGCCCCVSIITVILFSILWMAIPFIWALVVDPNHYQLDITAWITFGVAFCLWSISRLVCWRCWKSKSYRKREANEYEMRQFAVIGTTIISPGLTGDTFNLSSVAQTNLFGKPSTKINVTDGNVYFLDKQKISDT